LGVQLPVCARCTGLYGGGLLGLLVWTGARRVARARLLIGRRPAVTLAASAVPTLLSVASEVLGVWDPANAGRAALALPLGLATGAMLAAVVKGDLR
jgi:uncharacterized membrane protein